MIDHDSAGHYVVSGKKYHNKLEAYTVALPQGHWPHWHFHDEFFGQQNWTREPCESLQNLYAQRARHIREQYNYVIVWFSGGADSDNVVRSFLHNGLHIDEIWHRSSWQRLERTDMGLDSCNQANETRHTAIPLLQEYQQLSPGTKIKIFDAMNLAIDSWSNDPVSLEQTNYFNPLAPAKHLSHRFNETNCTGKIAKVTGVDKPRLHYRDGKYYFYFLDSLVNNQIMPSRLTNDTEVDLCFYWDPAAFEILSKQAHLVKNYFEKDQALRWMLDLKSFDAVDTKHYNSTIKSIIYPHWNNNCFQTFKASSDIDHEEFFWFYRNTQHQAFKNWFELASGYSNSVKRIYQDLLPEQHNYSTVGHFSMLPENYSKFYQISA